MKNYDEVEESFVFFLKTLNKNTTERTVNIYKLKFARDLLLDVLEDQRDLFNDDSAGRIFDDFVRGISKHFHQNSHKSVGG